MPIDPPPRPPDHPDRPLDCEEALEAEIHSTMDDALQAGWQEAEIVVAVQRLAFAWLRSEAENRATDNAIAAAKTKKPASRS